MWDAKTGFFEKDAFHRLFKILTGFNPELWAYSKYCAALMSGLLKMRVPLATPFLYSN